MARNHKISGGGMSVPVGIVIGVSISAFVAALGAFGDAYLVAKEVLPIDSIGIAAMLIVAVSSAVGALCAAKLVKQKPLLVCGLTALFFYLVLLSVTALLFGGIYDTMSIMAVMSMVGAGSSALLTMRKKTGKSRFKIPAYR